jgi:hypothetical protein
MVPPLTPAPASHTEAVGVVIAAVHALGDRQAAELAVPQNERRVEHAAALEVLDEPGDRLVGFSAVEAVIAFEIPRSSQYRAQRSP